MVIKGGLLILSRLLVVLVISQKSNSDEIFVIISYLTLCSIFRVGSISRLIELYNRGTESQSTLLRYTFFDYQIDGIIKTVVWLAFFSFDSYTAYNIIILRSIGEYSKVYFVLKEKKKLYGYFDLIIEFIILLTLVLEIKGLWLPALAVLGLSLLFTFRQVLRHIKFKVSDLSYFKIESISSLIYSIDNIVLSQFNLVGGFITNYNIIFRVLSIPQRLLDFTTHLTKSINLKDEEVKRTNTLYLLISMVVLLLGAISLYVLEAFSLWEYLAEFLSVQPLEQYNLLVGLIFLFIFSQLLNRYEKNRMIRLGRLRNLNKYNSFIFFAFLALVLIAFNFESWKIFFWTKILISITTLIIVRFENSKPS